MDDALQPSISIIAQSAYMATILPPERRHSRPAVEVIQRARWMTSEQGRVSRVSPVQTAMRNCTRDEGGPFEVSNQVLISSHRKLLLSNAMVVSVAETSGQDSDRQGRERRAQANRR
jgi:hypothetical protein